jgi:hypothetical protein
MPTLKEEILNRVNLATAPNLMAAEEALKFVQEIIMALEEKCDELEGLLP